MTRDYQHVVSELGVLLGVESEDVLRTKADSMPTEYDSDSGVQDEDYDYCDYSSAPWIQWSPQQVQGCVSSHDFPWYSGCIWQQWTLACVGLWNLKLDLAWERNPWFTPIITLVILSSRFLS